MRTSSDIFSEEQDMNANGPAPAQRPQTALYEWLQRRRLAFAEPQGLRDRDWVRRSTLRKNADLRALRSGTDARIAPARITSDANRPT